MSDFAERLRVVVTYIALALALVGGAVAVWYGHDAGGFFAAGAILALLLTEALRLFAQKVSS